MVSCLFLHFFQKHRTVLRSIRHTRPPPVWVDAPPDAARPHAGIPSSPEEELGCSVPAGPRRSQKREGVVQNVNTSKPTHPNQQKQRKQSNDTKQKQQKQPPAKPTHNRTQNTHKHKQTTQPNSVVPQVVDKKNTSRAPLGHPKPDSLALRRSSGHSSRSRCSWQSPERGEESRRSLETNGRLDHVGPTCTKANNIHESKELKLSIIYNILFKHLRHVVYHSKHSKATENNYPSLLRLCIAGHCMHLHQTLAPPIFMPTFNISHWGARGCRNRGIPSLKTECKDM